MGHRHSREIILDAALAAAIEEGLSQLTFGRLAARLGINDRMVVYYFPTKDDLIAEVVKTTGERLRRALAGAFTPPVRDHRELVRMAWPILTRPDIDAIFGLFLEVNGLATVGREPFRSLVAKFVGAWIGWAASQFDESVSDRIAEAEAAIALIDGLLLLRSIAGAESAGRAATVFGVV
jgi:AcrR family transcriptional regulator